MPVFLLEAFGAKHRGGGTDPPVQHANESAKNITLTINPEQMSYDLGIGRWRKRASQRARFPLMSTNFRHPDQKIRLQLRLNEEDLDIWKDRSRGLTIDGNLQGIVFRFNYRRSRPGFADINTAIGYFNIESLNATLAQESATIGASKGQLEWDTVINLQRVALNDSPLVQ